MFLGFDTGSTFFDLMICVNKNIEKEPKIIFIVSQILIGVLIYPFILYSKLSYG
jgi:hypothetical protein